MKKKKLIINGLFFSTKEKLKDYVKNSILYKYEFDTELNNADFKFMCKLIERHPEADDKIGCGIKSIVVRPNMGTRAFWIKRIDGTEIDVSYLKSVSQPSLLAVCKKAARCTVRNQILDYKQKNYKEGMICPVSKLRCV